MRIRKHTRRQAWVLILVTAIALPAGSIAPIAPAQAQPVGLPSMGSASSAELSPALEALLGNAIMEEGRRDPTYIHDPDVTQYLNAVAAKLVAHAPAHQQTIRVFGVRDEQINAFAMPGGYVGINSGLVVQAQSESELASVVAHELGHIVQRHIARGMTQHARSNHIMIASIVGALIAALAGSGDLAMGVAAFGQAGAIDQQLGFSRHAEHEADRVGFDMLLHAGYDPRGMVRMFQRLIQMSRLNEGQVPAFHSTHPQALQRLSDMENRVARMKPQEHHDSDDFWFVRAKLRVIQARDSQSQRRVRETLQQETQHSQGAAQAAAWYGLAFAALQRGEVQAASQAYQQALSAHGDSPYLAQIGIALAQRSQGAAAALASAEQASARWADSKGLAFAHAQALRDAGQHAEAVAFLRDCISRWPEEPQLYEWQAQSYAKEGQAVAARLTMATYYEKMGALPAAVTQLRQARNLSQDFYQQSEIDSRIRALRLRVQTERDLLKQFE